MSVLKKPSISTFIDGSCAVDRINKRLVVNRYPTDKALNRLAEEWKAIAAEYQLEKIWAWSWLVDVPALLKCGFQVEGVIAQDGNQPPVSMACFLNKARGTSVHKDMEDQVLSRVYVQPLRPLPRLTGGLSLRIMDLTDCPAISNILGEVFATYPSPMTDCGYIQELMSKGCLFAGAFEGDRLRSMVAAYPDREFSRCEITDCATLPDYRGRSLTARLMEILEAKVLEQGDYTLFSLARAKSLGMNRVFHRMGYRYQGRLINNCDISGGYEDMNLWVKYK